MEEDIHLDEGVEPLDTFRSWRGVLLSAVLVHLQTDAVEFLLDLLDDHSMSEEDCDGETTDELRDEDEADPSATPRSEEPDDAKSGNDGGSVAVDGVGNCFERVLVDSGRERAKMDVGRLNGIRGGLIDGSVTAEALSAGNVGRRARSVEVGRVDVVGVEKLGLLEVCGGAID
jgi:hypothetical protein